ncbi:B3/B4 domain-containing protein [Salinithrix halophila]|uniref:B3/B4 domain-containing protein n=1 Tax=Salinithrix halophila TaxID=1485204 RepID=UPI0036D37818
MFPVISMDPVLKERLPMLKLGVLSFDHCTVITSSPDLREKCIRLVDKLREEIEVAQISQLSEIQHWRDAFKKLGVSPTRYRPSAEALLRRILKGEDLFGVNSAVDQNNFFSLKTHIPFGSYDGNQIHSPIVCTVGNATDRYEGINGREVSMEGKLLLRDERGPFGSPYVDSRRTRVTEKTRRCFQVVFSLQPEDELETILEEAGSAFLEIHGGSMQKAVVF